MKVRMNPQEVMSCIDCVNAVGADMEGMSLSAVVKRGISIALQTLRSSEVIPTRDGFEYEQMIAPYEGLTRVQKIKVGHKLVMEDQQRQAMDIPPPSLHTKVDPRVASITPQEARLTRRRGELLLKQNADPDNFDGNEAAELDRISRQLSQIHNSRV